MTDDADEWERLTQRAIASTAKPLVTIVCPDCKSKVARVVAVEDQNVFVGQLRLDASFKNLAIVLGREIPPVVVHAAWATWRTNRLHEQALTTCIPCNRELTMFDMQHVEIMAMAARKGLKVGRITATTFWRPSLP